MTDRELLQQALDALEHLQTDVMWEYKSPTRIMLRKIEKAIRARLAQPEPVAMKFQIYKQTPPRGRELEPIHSALLPWVYDQDPSSGNTASMWVTPVATLPSPQREWVGLTDEEVVVRANAEVFAEAFARGVAWAELKLKEKNT